jgi:hypothetical protein
VAIVTESAKAEILEAVSKVLKTIVSAEIIYKDQWGRAIAIREIGPVKPGMVISAQVPAEAKDLNH